MPRRSCSHRPKWLISQPSGQGRFFAKRFAAKEAFAKALGIGVRAPATLPAIAVGHDPLGKPAFAYSDELAALLRDKRLSAHLDFGRARLRRRLRHPGAGMKQILLGPLMIDITGTELTDLDRERLCHPAVGGIILFARNYAPPGATGSPLCRYPCPAHAMPADRHRP